MAKPSQTSKNFCDCGRRMVILHKDRVYCTELCGMAEPERTKMLQEERRRAEGFRKKLNNFPPNTTRLR